MGISNRVFNDYFHVPKRFPRLPPQPLFALCELWPPGGSGCRALLKADAIVVLGCTPSSRLRRRVERGVQLYRQGVAPVVLLSGGGSGPEPEAEIMRRAASACGIPEATLLVEPNSQDTIGNARESAALLHARGWRTVALVSDRTHLPRAALLFRLAGIEVVGRSGVPSRSLVAEAAAAVREALALPLCLLRALVTGRETRRRRPMRGR
jgi:uncharacterized SAM-binding protein YcdF (DUF218 family)